MNVGEGSPTTLYRFYDADDRLLYVGITERGPQRWKEHRKSKGWWTKVVRISTEHFPTRVQALKAEERAIRQEKPAYNVIHNAGAAPPASDPSSWKCDKCGEVIDNGDGYVWCHPKSRLWECVHRRCDEFIAITGYWIAVERLPTMKEWNDWDDHLHTKRWMEHESDLSWNECMFRAMYR